MELKTNKMTIEVLKSLNRLLVIGFVGMTIVAVILSLMVYRFSKSQSRTLVPPVISQQMTISDVRPDDSYLTQMALFLLSEYLNVNPANVDGNYAVLLRYVNPAYYSGVDAALTSEAKFVKNPNNKSSAVFYPTDQQVSVENLAVKISGVLKKWAGERLISNEKKTYLLQFSYPNGVLKLNSIQVAGQKEGDQ